MQLLIALYILFPPALQIKNTEVDSVLDQSQFVADERCVLALAGVMGGASSEVSATTSSVIVESAIFSPGSVRRTAQRHSLRSEASHRFERGQESALAPAAADAVAGYDAGQRRRPALGPQPDDLGVAGRRHRAPDPARRDAMTVPDDRALATHARAWPFEEARKLVERLKRSGRKSVIFETGYGPSGLPHIGTFGEVARTTMVRTAFRILTEDKIPTRLLAFSDDMDGMRKVQIGRASCRERA